MRRSRSQDDAGLGLTQQRLLLSDVQGRESQDILPGLPVLASQNSVQMTAVAFVNLAPAQALAPQSFFILQLQALKDITTPLSCMQMRQCLMFLYDIFEEILMFSVISVAVFAAGKQECGKASQRGGRSHCSAEGC